MHSWTRGCRSRSCREGSPSFTFRTEREAGVSGHWHFVGIKIQSPLVRLQASRRPIQRSHCSQENSSPGPCWEAPWSVSHMEEQQSHIPTLPVSPGLHSTDLVLQLRHQKKPPLPSLDLPGPKADSFPPEGCFPFFPGKEPSAPAQKCHQPLPRPQQLQLPQPGLAGDGDVQLGQKQSP